MNQDKQEEAKKAWQDKAWTTGSLHDFLRGKEILQSRLLEEIEKSEERIFDERGLMLLEWFKELTLTIKP